MAHTKSGPAAFHEGDEAILVEGTCQGTLKGDRRPREAIRTRQGGHVKNIFVGNLHSETSAESIRSFFEPLGTVHKVKLMLDRKTGLSRGFAFVEMAVPEADRAIATLNGKVLVGQVADVHEGRQKVHGLASPPHVRNDATQDHP